MGICCGTCHVRLKDDDLVVMDNAYYLKHHACFDYLQSVFSIAAISTFSVLKEKYPLLISGSLEESMEFFEGEEMEEEEEEEYDDDLYPPLLGKLN